MSLTPLCFVLMPFGQKPDPAGGAGIAILRGHENTIWSVVFSPDGTRVLTASEDATARIWPQYKTKDDLFEHASKIVEQLQPLTLAEKCEFYLKPDGCGERQ